MLPMTVGEKRHNIFVVAMNQYGVVQALGRDPEEFWLVLLDPTLPSSQPIHKVLDKSLSQQELESELRKRGIHDEAIYKLIQQARAKR